MEACVELADPSPMLVIEIVSPGTESKPNDKRDYEYKPREYADRGIPELLADRLNPDGSATIRSRTIGRVFADSLTVAMIWGSLSIAPHSPITLQIIDTPPTIFSTIKQP